MEILNGRYGPYSVYKGANYRLPKNLHERVKELTFEQCMEVVKSLGDKPAATRKRSYKKK